MRCTGRSFRYAALGLLGLPAALAPAVGRAQATTRGAAPRNVILILSDDHRYDFMGFMERAPAWLETPSLDRMRAQGAHVTNARGDWQAADRKHH